MGKKKIDFNYNYMEEIYFPTVRQKLFLLHTDPVWYRFMLGGIIAEAFSIASISLLRLERTSPSHMLLLRIGLLFNTMYFFDLLLTWRQKFFFPYKYPYPNPIGRPTYVTILEFISIIPFELFIDVNSVQLESDLEYRLYLSLITLHSLKVTRFFYHIYNNRRDMYNRFKTRVIELVVVQTLVFTYMIHFLHLTNVLKNQEQIYYGFQIITCQVSGQGYISEYIDFSGREFFEMFVPFLAMLTWTFTIYPTSCFMILAFIENYMHRYQYVHIVRMFKNKIAVKYLLTTKNLKLMMDFFRYTWILRGGFTMTESDFSQKTLSTEMAMETLWPAFRHSMLFRRTEFYVLRALAPKFERNIRMPGEMIFSKNIDKVGLVYIAEGAIEILSNEDNDAGIISLTSGTCVGESALFIPHKSNAYFRCKTVCELYQLSRENFMAFQKVYATEYKILLFKMQDIIRKARLIKDYNDQLGIEPSLIDRQRIIWLKYSLHSFMCKKGLEDIHGVKNIFIRQDLEDIVKKQRLFHTYEYLDKLAIQERNIVGTDIIFARLTCPWIFKANSPFLKCWELINGIVTIACAAFVSYGFCVEYSYTVNVTLTGFYVFFIIDAIIQLITPVSPDSEAKTIEAVFAERTQTITFYLDMISIFYWKMIYFAIDTQRPWYELFKLLRLWRITYYFGKWNNKFLMNLVLYTTCMGSSVYVAFFYLLSCFFLLTNVTSQMLSPITLQFASGAGMALRGDLDTMKSGYIFIVANAMSLFVSVTVTSLFCGTLGLHYMCKSTLVGTIHALDNCVKKKRGNWVWVRLASYIDILISDKDVNVSKQNIAEILELPKHFEIILKYNMHFEVLRKMTLLTSLSDELIASLLAETDVMTIFTHSIFVSQGIIYKDVYVLLRGECRTVTEGQYFITPMNEPLNIMEHFYNIPTVTSTVALTDCIVLKFNFEKFFSLLYKSGNEMKVFKSALDMNRKADAKILYKLLFEKAAIVRARTFKPSFHRFSYFLAKDSFEEFDYHVPFDRIQPFHFIKFFLLRVTFYPEGRFLKYYEIFRCVIAFTSACLFTIPAINIEAYARKTGAYPYMLALDLFAVIDIYIRMHVAFYNPDGLLITHPWSTAKHYLTHGFIVDFIAVFPFDVFPMKVQYRVFLNAIHALQLHRILALRKYYSIHHLYNILNTISILCLILFLANFISGLIFIYDCFPWETIELIPEAKCKLFNYGTTEAHFHILFLVMSAQLCSGMFGKINPVELDRILTTGVAILTITGVYVSIIYKSYLFSTAMSQMIAKTEHIVGARRLIRLLAQHPKKNNYLIKEVAYYYDLHWDHVASTNVVNLTVELVSALRRDILFGYYGDNLVKYSIFSANTTETILFIKNMFLKGIHIVIPKSGYVITVNDVEENIYFLNNGSVDVLNIDGTKMLELTSGAFFGNFSGERFTRIKMSFVANVNTDLVCVKSLEFFKIITYFPHIQSSFIKICRTTLYYIPSHLPPQPPLRMTFDQYYTAVNQYAVFKVIGLIHLSYVCYFGVCVELYQIAVGEMHMAYLTLQFSMDIIHIIKEYLKFKMPYKDSHRIPIHDWKAIFAHAVRNKTELFVMIFTLIYLDWFVVLAYVCFGRIDERTFSYAISILRLNRLARVYYIIVARKNSQSRLSASSGNVVRWLYIFYWFFLSYQLVAVVTAVLDFMVVGDTPNLLKNVPVDLVRNLRFLSSSQKFKLYFKYLNFSNLIHINSNDKNTGPQNTTFNIYVICLFLYGMIINSKLLCAFFASMLNVLVIRRLYLKIASYLHFYARSSRSSMIIKGRIIENAKYSWTKNYYRSDYILNEVCARYLKEVVIDFLYGYLLRRHRILAHTHFDFLRQLRLHMKMVLYPCNSVVVYKKEGRRCMYFINKGEVAVYDVDFGYATLSLKTLEKGDSFGFIESMPYFQPLFNFTYVTTQHCEIIELYWDDWNYLLPFFPATEEYIKEESLKYINEPCIPQLHVEVRRHM